MMTGGMLWSRLVGEGIDVNFVDEVEVVRDFIASLKPAPPLFLPLLPLVPYAMPVVTSREPWTWWGSDDAIPCQVVCFVASPHVSVGIGIVTTVTRLTVFLQ